MEDIEEFLKEMGENGGCDGGRGNGGSRRDVPMQES
jgi:hypothetical protein